MGENLYSFFDSPKYSISVVGTASGYGLDDRRVGVRVLVGQELSLLHVVQTGSGAHRAFCSMGIGGSFPGGKEAGARN
jgi:hypothetical protein